MDVQQLERKLLTLEAEVSQLKRMIEAMDHQKKSATPKEFEINGQKFFRNGQAIHPNSKEGKAIQMILDRQHGKKELAPAEEKFLAEVKEEIHK